LIWRSRSHTSGAGLSGIRHINQTTNREHKMNKEDVIAIAEGLKQIEEGVETIQRVMREQNIKSIKEVAAELIPMLKSDDDEINESIIEHLEKRG
jgi:hypothetical protein